MKTSLSPATVQAMRNLSAMRALRANHWTVGRNFAHPVKRQPAAHTVAQKQTVDDAARQCAAEMTHYAVGIIGAVLAYLVLISF